MANRLIHHPLVSFGARLDLRVPLREPRRRGGALARGNRQTNVADSATRRSRGRRGPRIGGTFVARCRARGHSGSGRSTVKRSSLGRHVFVYCPAGSMNSRRRSPRLTGAGRAVRVCRSPQALYRDNLAACYSRPTVRSENLGCTGLCVQVPMIDSTAHRQDKRDRGMVSCTAARRGHRNDGRADALTRSEGWHRRSLWPATPCSGER
jgi:hypothetical protein